MRKPQRFLLLSPDRSQGPGFFHTQKETIAGCLKEIQLSPRQCRRRIFLFIRKKNMPLTSLHIHRYQAIGLLGGFFNRIKQKLSLLPPTKYFGNLLQIPTVKLLPFSFSLKYIYIFLLPNLHFSFSFTSGLAASL